MFHRITDKDVMVHVLNNPSNWSKEVVAEMTRRAINELERLWRKEGDIAHISSELNDIAKNA